MRICKQKARRKQWNDSRVKDLQPDNVKIWLDLIAAAEDAGLSEKVAQFKGGLADLDRKIAAKDPKLSIHVSG